MGRILVIEDEPGTRLLLQSRLEDLGHEVATAPTGAMGLMEARAARFDLFLVDVVLGAGVDGYEVCRRLKSMPQTHSVPVVILSGQTTAREDLHRGYEAGCEAFLIKGDVVLLEDVVRAMLRIKSLQDDLSMQNRLLEQQNRELHEERQRGADLELALRESGGRSLVFRELAAGRPDGALLVDSDGVVRGADRGAQDILGKDLEGVTLGRLAPSSGLEAFVRDARTEAREGFRFDLSARAGHQARSISASVLPVVPRDGEGPEGGLRVVLLLDAGRRRVASEMLRLQEQGVPRREFGPLVEAAREVYNPGSLLGTSQEISDVRTLVARIALGDGPVLVRGTEGAGKELVARILHFSGSRSGPFVPANCGAMSPIALESELFGHVKGAFTGAFADRPGLLHQAHMGTLFLDDISELPLGFQAKLLDLLRDGALTRVGSSAREHVDVRIVAGCSVDPQELVDSGRLRAELLAELASSEVSVPPLGERREDVPVVAAHYLRRFGPARRVHEISPEAAWVLGQYEWPGNVVELAGAVERACAFAQGQRIEVTDLPQSLRDFHQALLERGGPPPDMPSIRTEPANFVPFPPAGEPAADARAAHDAAPVAGEEEVDEVSLDHYEKMALLRALEVTDGDKLAAARLLKVGKSTLYRKLKRHGLS